jgi:DNA-binding GntR family transcriptional regulator
MSDAAARAFAPRSCALNIFWYTSDAINFLPPLRIMPKVFSILPTKETLADTTYRQIRSAIIRGQLAPAQRLVYRALSKEFGVSSTPVRDAVQRLASEGALSLDDRGVARVPTLSAAEYAEIINLRILLEGRAAFEAAEVHGGPGFIEKLEEIHARLSEAIARNEDLAALTANEEFHFLVIEAAKMPILSGLISALWMKCGPSLRVLYTPSYVRPKRHPHVDLIEALARRDGEAARLAVAEDLRHGGKFVLRKLTNTATPETPASWSGAKSQAFPHLDLKA